MSMVETEVQGKTGAKRRLMLRDAASLGTLVLVTGALFAITLFSFRSFSAHRAELGRRWSDRGREALQHGRAAEAVADVRTALTYAPGTRAYELLLAEALGQSGHPDESYSYFLGLWETAPGDGNLNLAIARLAAAKGQRAEAVNHYRAAVYGTWEGDGVERRAAVRIELARYLIAQHDLDAARTEILIAAGNTPDDYSRDLKFGQLFESAQDPRDAGKFYDKAVAAKPGDVTALEAAGRIAYVLSDYQQAHQLLDRAAAIRQERHEPEASYDLQTAQNAARLLELDVSPALPQRERVVHILAVRTIARKRFDSCATAFKALSPPDALEAQWTGPDATSDARTLLRDPSRQDAAIQLAFDTERQASSVCGAPSGDDALLLRLATAAASNSTGDAK